MSVLTVFEATPNRVRSLARLAAVLGRTTRVSLREYVMPLSSSPEQFNNLLRETIRLGLLVVQENEVFLGPNVSVVDLNDDEWILDYLDRKLLKDDEESIENRAFRYALSWLLAQPSGRELQWNSDQHLRMLEQMDGAEIYECTTEGRFAMLCYWARYLGYAAGLAIRDGNAVVPDPTEAIVRRLKGVYSSGLRLPVARFLDQLSRECPVLENGSVRREVEGRFHVKRSGNELSPATSLALWRLEHRGVIKLDHASDAETWLMSSSIVTAGAGMTRPVSHIEYRP